MLRIKEFFDKIRERNERGDVITALFMTPFAIFFLFAIVNMSLYFEARSSIQNIARDGARQVALYGGNNSTVPLNKTGKNVSQLVYNQLYAKGKCTRSHCVKPPAVTCTPGVASQAGQTVTCKVTYYYSPVASDIFGFAAATLKPFTVSESFISETGY